MAAKKGSKKAARVLTEAEAKLATLRKIENPTDAQKKEITATAATVKAEKFSRIAKKRVGKALSAIKLIGNLSGSGYAYTPEQVEKIKGHLDGAVKAVMSRFVPGGAKAAAAELDI